MKTIKGPGIFLVQFVSEEEPFDSLAGMAKWSASLGYKAVQIPSGEMKLFDLEKAAKSKMYCDEVKGILYENNIELIEIAAYTQGQVLALHPVYHDMFSQFFPKGLNDNQRIAWAAEQLKMAVLASANLNTKNISVLSGGFAWHMMYPWPQRPDGIIDEAFKELAKRWMPILDLAHENGITIGFELHPGSDLYDGATFEMFLEKSGNHPAACITYDPSHLLMQQMDYLEFIKLFGKRIKCFHVKDAEFRPNGRTGVYGGYQPWAKRAGRFRSLGDGQIDFKRIFTLLTEADYEGWAVLEWECCVKSPEQGASQGAEFISRHIIEATEKAFDDFAGGQSDYSRNHKLLGFK